jgi:hypothetical protein
MNLYLSIILKTTKPRITAITAIIIFIVCAILYSSISEYRFSQSMNKDGVYTIGTIESIKSLSKGGPLSRISYTYKNTLYYGEYIGDLSSISKPHIGKHFFIKIIPGNPKMGILFKLTCIVPDSIIAAPPGGWSNSWMEYHFPDCVR